MKKYTHVFILMLCALFCMLAVPADEAQAAVTVGDFEFEQYSGDSGYTLTKYNGSDAAVTIPDTVNGRDVISIGTSAFEGTDITKVDLSGTKVTSIGYYAFSDCASLTEVSFPATLETIDNWVFYKSGIEKVDLSQTKLTSIPYMAFDDCTKLVEVNFPSTLETIEGCAFVRTSLTKVDLGHTELTKLGQDVFASCTRLVEITLPATLESIGSRAFFNTDLTKIDLPENLTEVEPDIADDRIILLCSRASQTAKALGAENRFCDLAYPDWLWSYDENETLMVAGYMGDARVITLPNDATVVAPYALWKSDDPDEREAITSITIPEGYTAIGERALYSRSGYLVHISLPSTLKTIGARAFLGCEFAMIQLPEGLETIGEEAFTFCWELESLTIPTKVKSIPAPIVYECDVLRSVVLHADLTYIADDAFGDDLTDVYCYRGSYAAQWAKEQNLLVHYITDSTFASPVITGPSKWDEEYTAYDVGMTQPWMEGISVGLMEPGAEYRFVCTSSDPDVARVSGNKVEYLKPGTAALTITLEGMSGVTPCTITKEVYKPVEDFTVPSVVFAKLPGNGRAVDAYAPIQIQPADANPWFTSCEKGHTTTSYRQIQNGQLLVEWTDEPCIQDMVITSRSGLSRNIRVIFYNTISSLEAYAPTRDLVMGEIYDPDITLTVDGSPVGNLDIYTITSSNPNVAVGVDGKHVKAVGRGTATITVKEANSKLSTSFTVRVDMRDAMLTPRFLTVIGPEAFAGIGAKEVILYDECTEIQSRAFANCANLERIEIPASVKTIAEDAFTGCPGDLTIVAPSYSAAKTFADQHGYLWENLAQ